jgi:hypothetical protein
MKIRSYGVDWINPSLRPDCPMSMRFWGELLQAVGHRAFRLRIRTNAPPNGRAGRAFGAGDERNRTIGNSSLFAALCCVETRDQGLARNSATQLENVLR